MIPERVARPPASARPGSPSPTSTDVALSNPDLAELAQAKQILEHPGLAARLAAIAGSPLEKGMNLLPSGWRDKVHEATQAALLKALDVAVSSLGLAARRPSRDRLHKFAAAASGAIGGAFGLPPLALQPPGSTTPML